MLAFAGVLAAAVAGAFLADSTGTLGVRILTAALLAGCAVADARLLLVATFAAMPFQQSILGGDGPANVSASDLLTAVASLLLVRAAVVGGLRGGAAMPGLALFLALSVVSSAVAYEGRSTAVSVGRNFTVTLVPLLLFASVGPAGRGGTAGPAGLAWRLRAFERAIAAYVASATLLAGFVVLTFARGGAGAAMYTLAMHKNALGPTLGLGVVACLAGVLALAPGRRAARRLALAGLVACAVGLLLSFSRGAWLSTAAACTIVLYASGRSAKAVPAAVLGTLAVGLVWQLVPESTATYATDISSRAHTIQTRLDSIEDTLALWRQSPWLGQGVGLRKVVAPHNLVVEMLGEVGLVGVALFALAVAGGVVTLRSAWRRAGRLPEARPVLLAAIGVFAVTLLHGLADAYWRRGVAAGGWAAVGMAAAVVASVGGASAVDRRAGGRELARGAGPSAG